MASKVLLTFDQTVKEHLLSRFGIGVDEEGFLIDKKTSRRVLSVDERELKQENLAAILKGSIKLYDTEPSSLFNLVDAIYNK